ncbi:fumarylacetoacetate hydrolase family protein [Rhodoblastus sp. 17X3]|uniref:fumarylacetoacetate hydrolase family protein n=1 Tax=Rhodoblastus sp. 17X3 TaxID=3047026 RepID=UPI0024B6718A|nr:fumarylacetoacetate hydrolase family protein [Rhodoblastus sp. 17X3]MDI9850226.1 fumarylacetoacetate hydrolase family protein [Rhodoblastus sp. 17X3]
MLAIGAGVIKAARRLDQHVQAHQETELSTYVALAPGDLIFTGTPSGVGPLVRGDVLVGDIAGVGEVRTKIV